jgi:hypothetical protein
MRVVDIDFPYDMLVLDDVYTEEQQGYMWSELTYLYEANLFLDPEHTRSATDEDGTIKKSNKAVFPVKIYPKEYLDKSALIMVPRTVLLQPEVIDLMRAKNPAHGILENVNMVSPIISYYESHNYYDFHYDLSAYSTLSYLVKEPRAFEGGEVVFRVNDHEVTIPIQNNRVILFPSCYQHAVKEVFMDPSDEGKMLGRFCVGQFLLIHSTG